MYVCLPLLALFLNGPSSSSFSFIFGLLKQSATTYCEKNVHPISSAGIRTHDLLNISLLPLPLDQGPHRLFYLLYLCLFPFSFPILGFFFTLRYLNVLSILLFAFLLIKFDQLARLFFNICPKARAGFELRPSE